MRIYLLGLLLAMVYGCAEGQAKNKVDTTAFKKKTAKVQYGVASWYSDKFNGRQTSSGEIFNQKKLTCAHNALPMGTWLKVTNIRNKRSVLVKVNDRLHPKNKRLVDLSRAAAEKLGIIKLGLAKVRLDVLGKNPGID